MGTTPVESRKVKESVDRGMSRAGASGRSTWHSDVLKRRTVSRVIMVLGDAVALVVAHWVAERLVMYFFRVPAAALNPRNYAAFYLPFLLAVLFLFGKNQMPDLRRPETELELTLKGVSFAFLLLVCANFVVFKTGFSRYLMVCWYLLTLVALLWVHFGMRVIYGALWKRGIARKRTLLVGSVEKLFELKTVLSIQRYWGYDLLGIVPVGHCQLEGFEKDGLPVLGSSDNWHEMARESGAEQVIVAFEERTPEAHELVSDILKRCLIDGIDVQVYSDLFASREFNYELDDFSGFFRFFAAARWSKQVQLGIKRMLDFTAGVVGSLLTLAVLPVIGLVIKLQDGGPIFYRSEFIDSGGRIRYYLKFRSMHANAKEILERNPDLKAKFEQKHKLIEDPRVTGFGRLLRKYSVDELPSFFSVLRGHLSLVGPRTICGTQVYEYGPRLPKLLSVKPGLTGFWQVMGRQLTTYQEKVQMDMFYIEHWSIWLDLWIIVKTFWTVLRAEGAF